MNQAALIHIQIQSEPIAARPHFQGEAMRTRHEAKILLEGPDEVMAPIGRIEFSVLRLDTAEALEIKQRDIFVTDFELNEFAQKVWDTPSWEKITRKMGNSANRILYVEALEIEKDHQGKRLGLAALLALIQYSNFGCGMITLHAHPYSEACRGLTDTQRKQKAEALVGYYQALGFERLTPKGTYMYLKTKDLKDPFPLWDTKK